jgi:hypothetical protein
VQSDDVGTVECGAGRLTHRGILNAEKLSQPHASHSSLHQSRSERVPCCGALKLNPEWNGERVWRVASPKVAQFLISSAQAFRSRGQRWYRLCIGCLAYPNPCNCFL